MNYRNKYLKYKNKYLLAKNNLVGGNNGIPNKELAIDEIYFWGRQIGEHALFLHLGIEEEKLKARAKEIHDHWMNYMQEQFYDKGIALEKFDIGNPNKVKISLDAEDYKKLGNINSFNFAGLFELIEETRAYKTEVKQRLEANEWLGWLFHSFVVHVLMELDAFDARIKGKQSEIDDIKFYNKMSKDHTGFAEKLSDKVAENKELEDLLRDVYNKEPSLNETITEKDQYKLISLKYLEMIEGASIDLQNKVHNKNMYFTIHPDLIDHVVREQSNATIKLLKMKSQ